MTHRGFKTLGMFIVSAVVVACGGGSDTAPVVSAAPTPDVAARDAASASPGTASPANKTWVNCAPEWGTCAVPGTRQVRYGANGTYVYKDVTGSIACTNAVWGDPLVGVVKACDYDSQPTAAAPPPPSPNAGAPLAGVPSAREGQTVLRSVTVSNAGAAPLALSVDGGDNASGVSPRTATVAAGASLELRVALACDQVQSRRVSYALQTDEAGSAAQKLEFDVDCAGSEGSFSGPITITKGGTYAGNWASTDVNVPPVSIRTTEPVIIENCQVRGPGNLIASRFSDSDGFPNVDVTVRNCVGTGTGSLDAGRNDGHFFIAGGRDVR